MMSTSDLIPIPGGEFLMGQNDGRDDERPAHRVTVNAFRMARCQVTNADYAAFRKFDFTDATLPVVSVSWLDAVAYCEWLPAPGERPAAPPPPHGRRPPAPPAP